jgi:hypothetical protein
MQLTFVEIGRATRAWAGYNAVTPSGSIVAGVPPGWPTGSI